MRSDRLAALIGAAIVLGLLGVRGSVSPGQEPAAKPSVAWEYKIASFLGEDEEKSLSNLGQQGWELVAVHGNPIPIYYLKRLKR